MGLGNRNIEAIDASVLVGNQDGVKPCSQRLKVLGSCVVGPEVSISRSTTVHGQVNSPGVSAKTTNGSGISSNRNWSKGLCYIKEGRIDASIGIGYGNDVGTGWDEGIDLRGLSIRPRVGIGSSTTVRKSRDVPGRIAMASHVNDRSRNQKRVGLGNEEGGIEHAPKGIDDMKVVLPDDEGVDKRGRFPSRPRDVIGRSTPG